MFLTNFPGVQLLKAWVPTQGVAHAEGQVQHVHVCFQWGGFGGEGGKWSECTVSVAGPLKNAIAISIGATYCRDQKL